MQTFEIIVSGRVQGVGYRYFTVKMANVYGIKGYVKNTTDGKVKVVASGEELSLNMFIERLKEGPHAALVDNVQVCKLVSAQDFSNFRIEF